MHGTHNTKTIPNATDSYQWFKHILIFNSSDKFYFLNWPTFGAPPSSTLTYFVTSLILKLSARYIHCCGTECLTVVQTQYGAPLSLWR